MCNRKFSLIEKALMVTIIFWVSYTQIPTLCFNTLSLKNNQLFKQINIKSFRATTDLVIVELISICGSVFDNAHVNYYWTMVSDQF